jgi:hypothetical protein
MCPLLDTPIPQRQRMPHVVGDHQRRQPLISDDLAGQLQDLARRFRIESGDMFVEQQHFRPHQRCQNHGQRLSLPTREQTDPVLKAVFQAEPDPRQLPAETLTIPSAHSRAESPPLAALRGKSHVLLDGRRWAGSQQRVLEYPGDQGSPAIFGPSGHIPAVDDNAARIKRKAAGYGIE